MKGYLLLGALALFAWCIDDANAILLNDFSMQHFTNASETSSKLRPEAYSVSSLQ
jgi:hypothetical protein